MTKYFLLKIERKDSKEKASWYLTNKSFALYSIFHLFYVINDWRARTQSTVAERAGLERGSNFFRKVHRLYFSFLHVLLQTNFCGSKARLSVRFTKFWAVIYWNVLTLYK
jgi:hypothetical protein